MDIDMIDFEPDDGEGCDDPIIPEIDDEFIDRLMTDDDFYDRVVGWF